MQGIKYLSEFEEHLNLSLFNKPEIRNDFISFNDYSNNKRATLEEKLH